MSDPSVAQFLSQNNCLIVEPSSPFLQNMTACLVSLGAVKANVQYAMRFEDAYPLLEAHKPKLVIMEYQIGEHFGLQLIDRLDQLVGEDNRIAIFATRNSSDSAVAEAAEEQVDAYILKPFSMGEFKEKLEETIQRKASPNPYHQKIRAGKKAVVDGDFAAAQKEFESAKLSSAKPSLAHYYSGYLYEKQNQIQRTIIEYKMGLSLTPLHYRCLVGEFDALYHVKKYEEAYELVKDIKANYPVSPQRFGKILITSVYSKHLGDLPELYRIYTSFQNRPPELVKITVATFKLAARVMLKENQLQKAYEYFDMGAMASGLNWEYMSDSIRELLNANATNFVEEIFKKVPRQHQATDLFQLLNFYLKAKTAPANDAFEFGKKILNTMPKGEMEFYRILVDLAVKTGRKLLAEDIINKAVLEFPDMRQELYKRLEEKI